MIPRPLIATSISTAVAVAILAASPEPRRVSLIITGGTVVTMDTARPVLNPGAVAVDGDTIVAIDRPDAIAEAFTAASQIDASGQIVLPGLINTHTHAPMVLYRGLSDDLQLMDWLQKYIFPAEAKTVSPEFVAAGTRLAALEMIQSGTTTFVDMYYFEEDIAKATRDAGLRAVLGQTVIRFPVPDAPTPADSLARAERFIQAWKGNALITPAVAPHAMYTLEKETLIAARNLSLRNGVPTLIHLAETEDEVRISKTQHGMTPTAYLDSIGFLGAGVLAAHGVWLTEADISILRSRGIGVSHNPESNMKLASGVAPVPGLLAAGVPVGLGTDGAASNNDLDMFEAMRQTALVHKLTGRDPRLIPASTALHMATTGGAAALGMGDRIGTLSVGRKADIILVSTQGARQTPLYDPISHLVYAAHGDDVRTTIVNGRVLMRDRRMLTLDEPAVLAEARVQAERVRAAVRFH